MKILGIEFGVRNDAPAVRDAPPFVRKMPGGFRRGYEAGIVDRLTNSWTRTDVTVNQSLLKDLRLMRARSRDFFRNNEYGRKFGSLVKTNVIGPNGFTLKVDARREDGSLDEQDSVRVRDAYRRFSKKGNYEVTGRLSETQFDALAIGMIARDGEVLIRKVAGRDRGIHGCQLQLVPAHVLDEELNRELANGARIRMGVEFDAWMKPTAYYFRKYEKNSDIHGNWSQNYTRVPAEDVIHLFISEEVDQWRGAPWAYAALRRARHLDQFDEAALVAANVGAAKMGFFQQKDPEAGPPIRADEEDDGAGERAQEFTSEASPGQFDIMPDGYELKEWDPNYPSDVYDPFTKAIARALATGCLVSYHGLTGDLTQVNFSSIRSGTLDEREMWKLVQSWYVESCKEPVFEWWLGYALVNDPQLRVLPYAKFDKYNAPLFFGRRWDWVDPKSDVIANAKEVELGTNSRTNIMRERGRDPDKIAEELAAEAAELERMKAAED